jgi:hypothetical protein
MSRLVAPTLLLILVLCAPAGAATVRVDENGVAHFAGQLQENNGVTVSRPADAIVFHDNSAGVFPVDASCATVDLHTVRCAPSDVVDVALGAADDRVSSVVPGHFDGGAGNDRVTGSAGVDDLLGGPGDDGLAGGTGDDIVQGGAGHDFVLGGGGTDLIVGGAGPDVVLGYGIRATARDGADDLRGGPGRDALYGGPERDTLACGAGRDLAVVLGPDRADEGDCEVYRSAGVCLDVSRARRIKDRIVLRNRCDEPNRRGRSVRLRGPGERLATGVATRHRAVLRLTRRGRARLRPGRSLPVRLLVWPTDQTPPAQAPRVVVRL